MNILTVLTVNKLNSLWFGANEAIHGVPTCFFPKAWAQKRLAHRVGSNRGWILPSRSPTSVATCLSQPWSNIVAAIHQTELMGENNICSYVGTASCTWLTGSRIFSPQGRPEQQIYISPHFLVLKRGQGSTLCLPFPVSFARSLALVAKPAVLNCAVLFVSAKRYGMAT